MSDLTAEAFNRWAEELARIDKRNKAAGPIHLDDLRAQAAADKRPVQVRVSETMKLIGAGLAHANEVVPPFELEGSANDRRIVSALLANPEIAKDHLVAFERCAKSGVRFVRAYWLPSAQNGSRRLLVTIKSPPLETGPESAPDRLATTYHRGHRAEELVCLVWDENDPPGPVVVDAGCPQCRHQVRLDRVVKMAATRRTGLKGRRR